MLFAVSRPLFVLASWRFVPRVFSFEQASSMCGHALVSIRVVLFLSWPSNKTPDFEKGDPVALCANKDNAKRSGLWINYIIQSVSIRRLVAGKLVLLGGCHGNGPLWLRQSQ